MGQNKSEKETIKDKKKKKKSGKAEKIYREKKPGAPQQEDYTAAPNGSVWHQSSESWNSRTLKTQRKGTHAQEGIGNLHVR